MTSLVKTAAGWGVAGVSGTGLLPPGTTLGSLLELPAVELTARVAAVPLGSASPGAPLAPVDDDTEVWAAGVTYEVSREARMEESGDAAIYARVYDAERPELFFKSIGRRVRGPGEVIGVREDSTWDVPEPELAVVANALGEIVGYTVVNDVSSRSIEGENPLYLPQAKMYRGSCAAGPSIVLASAVPDPYALAISVRIDRGGAPLWSGQTTTARLHRKLPDLVASLYRGDRYPRGVVLATGTSAVPGPDVTLQDGDEVTITIDGIGTLHNPVRRGLFP
ncbi:fumarylacetoacetate hydrolase family protein [Amycolatopsis sp. FDAARGOS 1241]|uniref:fumarylacetoacetate hydrolase family protein n=1 Tax=Amycolatopsis sp. FDAARGOS 1241 TaxID=2778070 RepID=UPI0019520F1B|nr:fumarylacetoacetate hydrolase family protein [Amycolatopsis sp. FDAARGOS 1241]QRP49140.1 fumarylacetoacetate hydrolase family protein [Amycolatopsis sp. FDAARGOS 1241]